MKVIIVASTGMDAMIVSALSALEGSKGFEIVTYNNQKEALDGLYDGSYDALIVGDYYPIDGLEGSAKATGASLINLLPSYVASMGHTYDYTKPMLLLTDDALSESIYTYGSSMKHMYGLMVDAGLISDQRFYTYLNHLIRNMKEAERNAIVTEVVTTELTYTPPGPPVSAVEPIEGEIIEEPEHVDPPKEINLYKIIGTENMGIYIPKDYIRAAMINAKGRYPVTGEKVYNTVIDGIVETLDTIDSICDEIDTPHKVLLDIFLSIIPTSPDEIVIETDIVNPGHKLVYTTNRAVSLVLGNIGIYQILRKAGI